MYVKNKSKEDLSEIKSMLQGGMPAREKCMGASSMYRTPKILSVIS